MVRSFPLARRAVVEHNRAPAQIGSAVGVVSNDRSERFLSEQQALRVEICKAGPWACSSNGFF